MIIMYRLLALLFIGIFTTHIFAASTGSNKADPDAILVVVNNTSLMQKEADREVELRICSDRDRLTPDRLAMLQRDTQRSVVKEFINRQALLAETDRQKIQADPAIVEERWRQVQSGRPPRLTPADILRIHLISLDRTRDDVIGSVRIDALLNKLMTREVTVSAEDIERYRQEHAALFNPPEKAKFHSVYVKVPKDAVDEVRVTRRKQIDEIHAMLNDDDDVFSQLKKQYADDSTSGVYCGTFRGIEPGEMGPAALDEVVFSIDTNTVSPVIESELGYHIVQVIYRKKGHIPDDGSIKYVLGDKIRQNRLEAFMENLLNKSEIQ